eukprot:8488762-Pyramimonas_sp.AAC.1
MPEIAPLPPEPAERATSLRKVNPLLDQALTVIVLPSLAEKALELLDAEDHPLNRTARKR